MSAELIRANGNTARPEFRRVLLSCTKGSWPECGQLTAHLSYASHGNWKGIAETRKDKRWAPNCGSIRKLSEAQPDGPTELSVGRCSSERYVCGTPATGKNAAAALVNTRCRPCRLKRS